MADDMPEWQKMKLGAVVSVVVGLAVGLVICLFEPFTLAEVVGSSVGVITLMWVLCKPELDQRWFRLFMTTIIIAHGAVIFAALWPGRHQMGRWDPRLFGFIVGFTDLIVTFVVAMLFVYLAQNSGKTRPSV